MPARIDESLLNAQQLEAVYHESGPIMVLAGAGSGKTRVITYRIARLLAEGISPASILAVTFTNKAAREMRERIEKMANGPIYSLKMGTFHSIAARWLRVYGTEIGLDSQFLIYDDDDQMTAMRAIMKDLEIDTSQYAPRTILNKISRAKEKLIDSESYKAGYSPIDRYVAQIYPIYSKRLRDNNALDFDDLIMFTVKLLSDSEEVREKLQDQIRFIFVDEYQDVNFAQYRMISILAEQHRNLMVVGDDDQSIYSWRGADSALMRKFNSDYPDAKTVILAQNYRSTENILNAANAVIINNSNRTHKNLWCEKGEGEKIHLKQALNERQEAMYIADRIQSEVARGNREFKDFGVLYRTNAQSRILEEVFLLEGIPHILVGGQRFFQRAEIRDAIAYLRLVFNPMDRASFQRVIGNPPRGLGQKAIQMVDEYAEVGTDPLTALDQLVNKGGLTAKAREGARSFLEAIAAARLHFTDHRLVAGALNCVLEKSGYIAALTAKKTDEAVSRLENVHELINTASEHDEAYAEANPADSISQFLESVSLAADVDALKETGNTATLMTCHAAKGLEFPVVFVTGLEENLFPHTRSKESDSELQEERRLFYVAMTRAMDELHLTYAIERTIMGSYLATLPSKFLKELPRECLAESYIDETRSPFSSGLRSYGAVSQQFGSIFSSKDSDSDSKSSASTRTEPAPPRPTLPYKIGDKVQHPKFGEGVVMACEPTASDHAVTVVFGAAVGVKKIMAKLAKLQHA